MGCFTAEALCTSARLSRPVSSLMPPAVCAAQMFGSDAPIMMWDPDHNYTADKVELYFQVSVPAHQPLAHSRDSDAE